MLKNTNHFIENYHKDTQSISKYILLQLPDDYKGQLSSFYEMIETLYNNDAYYTYLNPSDLENLTFQDLQDETQLGYFYCLYHCNPLIVLDSKNTTTLNNKVAIDNFGYKDEFYLTFISNKDSITAEYLEARKALYHSISQIKQESQEQESQELKKQQEILEQSLQNLDSKQREFTLKDSQKQQEKQRQEQKQASFNTSDTSKYSHLILDTQDKNIKLIFLDKLDSKALNRNISMSNLIHIHNNKIDIFLKDTSILDIQELESLIKAYSDSLRESNNIESQPTLDSLHSANTQVFFYSTLLTGSLPHKECYFGELDASNTQSTLGLNESKPIYQLINKVDSNYIESKIDSTDSNNTLSTLHIFLNNSILTILNYSLLDSSLNIKLESKSTESKEILEREKAQKQKDSSLTAQNDNVIATAFLHPILEDNEIKCPHNGVVQLKSNKGKSFKSKGIPMILESDLLYSQIIGCTNNIAGVPTPCTMVATILPNARGLKKFNDDYPIMQDLVSGNVFSDKGFPITCTPKPNTFKINSPKPIDSNTQNKQKLESQINLYRPTLRLHYKITPLQKDNLPIYRLKLNDSIIESNNDTPLDSITIDIAKDTKDLHDIHNLDKALQDTLSILHSNLKQSFMKEYMYKYVSLQLDSNMLLLILLIPQKIPKIYKEAYKEYHDKEYGVGRYTYLYEYCYHKDLDIKDYAKIGLDSNPSNATILTLHTAYEAQRLEIALANGLDSLIESKERQRQAKLARESKESKNSQQDKRHNTDITSSHIESQTIESKQKDSKHNTKQIIDSLLTLKLINGGYKDKLWSYGEEVEEEIEEKIDISQGILIASNDDAIAYQALEEMNKKEKWRQLKTSYLAIHNITQTDIKMSRQRIGEKRLWDWIHSEDNYLEYGENEFIKAEIRYHKIGGPIYDVFLKTPHQYINTCAARISKALTDFGIVIKKLQGMKSNAYVANAGTNTKPYKILVRVEDMIDFLKLNDSLGEPIVFRPKANQTSDAFCKEVLSSLNANGIIAMIIAFRDAGGHVTLWDNDKGEFLDNVDNSDGVNYMNGRYNIREVYFWEIAR